MVVSKVRELRRSQRLQDQHAANRLAAERWARARTKGSLMLLDLPPELLCEIALHLNIAQRGNFSETCKTVFLSIRSVRYRDIVVCCEEDNLENLLLFLGRNPDICPFVKTLDVVMSQRHYQPEPDLSSHCRGRHRLSLSKEYYGQRDIMLARLDAAGISDSARLEMELRLSNTDQLQFNASELLMLILTLTPNVTTHTIQCEHIVGHDEMHGQLPSLSGLLPKLQRLAIRQATDMDDSGLMARIAFYMNHPVLSYFEIDWAYLNTNMFPPQAPFHGQITSNIVQLKLSDHPKSSRVLVGIFEGCRKSLRSLHWHNMNRNESSHLDHAWDDIWRAVNRLENLEHLMLAPGVEASWFSHGPLNDIVLSTMDLSGLKGLRHLQIDASLLMMMIQLNPAAPEEEKVKTIGETMGRRLPPNVEMIELLRGVGLVEPINRGVTIEALLRLAAAVEHRQLRNLKYIENGLMHITWALFDDEKQHCVVYPTGLKPANRNYVPWRADLTRVVKRFVAARVRFSNVVYQPQLGVFNNPDAMNDVDPCGTSDPEYEVKDRPYPASFYADANRAAP